MSDSKDLIIFSVSSPNFPSLPNLGNKYPKFYQHLMSLAQDCSDSRMYMGLHYASDAVFGSYVADCILEHPEFKKKYKL